MTVEVEVNDTNLYGKFLVEWDRVISDLEKFVETKSTVPKSAGLSSAVPEKLPTSGGG